MAITSTKPNTTSVVCPASWRVGQTTLRTSRQESLVKPINSLPAGQNSEREATPSKPLKNALGQGQRESNPQPSVLETDALPVELYPFLFCSARIDLNPTSY